MRTSASAATGFTSRSSGRCSKRHVTGGARSAPPNRRSKSRRGVHSEMRRGRIVLWFCSLMLVVASLSAFAEQRPWNEIVAKARGQDVDFNAWAGDEKTNAFIAWVAGEVRGRYGIT